MTLGLLHGAQRLDGLDSGDDDLQASSLGPHIDAADDDDFAADLDGRVHLQASAAPHDAVHLPVLISQREVDVAVVNAPLRDLSLKGLMLEQWVVFDGVLDQSGELSDGQRARCRFMTR